LVASAAVAASGCSRSKYRLQADRDVGELIAERNGDPRWALTNSGIGVDPRSRYFDAYDPDHAPMPEDDPASHGYLHCVAGKKGWKHWHDNGMRAELENPAWRNSLAEYAEIGEDGSVKLDIDSALRLAYLHSPSHQKQLETLYLSALDVSAERFRLDTQFFGGYGVQYAHNGSLIPPQLSYDPLLNRFVIIPAIKGEGVENNRLTVGRPFAANPALQARRRFATAGELLVGFANSFVFEFTGSNANLSASLANFSFIQPLLRGAGRDIALQELTLEERNLLANLRAYGQFRQGFYTLVAIGELGVTGPQRLGGSTDLQSFSGQGGVGGYLGLLQAVQQIRNSEHLLSLQLRTLARLEALLDNDLIDLVQVDQFRQSVENERANLLLRRNALALELDRYKTGTLCLPPDLPVALDDSLIRQFQLVPREAREIQESVLKLQRQVRDLGDDAAVAALQQTLSDASGVVAPLRLLFDGVRQDLDRLDAVAPARRRTMSAEEDERFQADREQLGRRLAELRLECDGLSSELKRLEAGLTEETRAVTLRRVASWIAEFLQLAERLVLVPARARLEAIAVDSVELKSEDAFQVALAHRLDFMNGRAALVDRWRLIQVSADALQSVLNVTGSGDLRTARNNPVSFRAPTGSLRMGLEFDAPFTRLLERNAYRESLIQYQQSRRSLIQSRDELHLGLRALLRDLDQLRQNLEIQRRSVTIAIRRVEQTLLSLNPPRQPPQPGQRPPINPTTAINLLGAQTALRDSQNALLGVWLNYYATKLRLYRELGVMTLDDQGRWIEHPLPDSTRDATTDGEGTAPEELPLPPAVPTEWLEQQESLPPTPPAPPPVVANPPGDADAKRPRPPVP
jgi:hypothetical protein